MALMTHARNAPSSGDYRLLTPAQRNEFDRLTAAADNAGTDDHYRLLMVDIANITGITLPTSGDIRRCGCLTCWACPTLFDAEHPDAHVTEDADPGYNLARIQCPACADEHRETA